jgi:hypothetical protein
VAALAIVSSLAGFAFTAGAIPAAADHDKYIVMPHDATYGDPTTDFENAEWEICTDYCDYWTVPYQAQGRFSVDVYRVEGPPYHAALDFESQEQAGSCCNTTSWSAIAYGANCCNDAQVGLTSGWSDFECWRSGQSCGGQQEELNYSMPADYAITPSQCNSDNACISFTEPEEDDVFYEPAWCVQATETSKGGAYPYYNVFHMACTYFNLGQ